MDKELNLIYFVPLLRETMSTRLRKYTFQNVTRIWRNFERNTLKCIPGFISFIFRIARDETFGN